MNDKFIFKIIIFYQLSLNLIQAGPILKIDQGFLNGTTFKTRNRTISAFLGIPYGQPPIGELRFKNPLPAKKWYGIRSAHQEGNSCIQMSVDHQNISGEEDCLYLNVFTPHLKFTLSLKESRLLPVMVWIHGGGFYFGSSSPNTYGPKYLLDKDIVLVSMNYRLGIFGFLTTGDSVAPGNFGMKDQVLALKWVKKNIRKFGGNPNRVTIFGESAGGGSVNLHALSDLNHGLFHQYIIQSGSVLALWAYRNRTDFIPYIKEVAENVGCLNTNSKRFVNCLRKKSVETLLRANPSILKTVPGNVWIPTDEPKSKDAFLIDSPQNLISQNKMKDQPFISGTVVDEGLLMTSLIYMNKMSFEKIKSTVDETINAISSYYSKNVKREKFREIIKDYYFKESLLSVPNDKLLSNLTTFLGDSQFLYPQIALIDKVSKTIKRPFYFYSFGYFSLNMPNVFEFLDLRENVGVPHAAELSYLFFKNTNSTMSDKDEKILNLMVDLWTSFAINGKPSSYELENPNLWQPYAKNKSFLQIGNISDNTDPSVTVDNNYFSPRMDFWRKKFPISLNFV